MASVREELKKDYWITTKDNPFDPFTQFYEWFKYDTFCGYNTAGLIARFANTSLDLSDEEYNIEVNLAINRIMDLGLLPPNAIRVENVNH